MAAILKIKDPDTGTWKVIRAIRGTSAYEAALAGGYTGTEEEFNQTLSKINPDGTVGKDGKTPIRGEDYWTAADKNEIVSDVLEALPVWTGGSY